MIRPVGEHPFMHEIVKDVKETRYSVYDAFTALKILGDQCIDAGISLLDVERINMIYCTLFYPCFDNCRRLAYKISAYEACMICPKLIAACKIHCKSPSRRHDGLTMLHWFTVHEATLSAYTRESAYVRSHMGCGNVHKTMLFHVPQIFQRRKSDANKQDFEINLNWTFQVRSTPKIIGILTKVFCTLG